jgi:thioredoxin-dependent peroxiredoxin
VNRREVFIGVAAFLCVAANNVWAKGDSMLKPGDSAPLFSLVTHAGDTVSLASFRDSAYVVLVFYPGDETPGCTKQLCELRDNYAILQSSGAVVFGVNSGNRESHQKFVNQHSFPFPLLVDEKAKVAEQYGCKGAIMIQRTVYVVGPNGTIVFAERGKPSPQTIRESIEAEKKKAGAPGGD